MPLHKHQHQHQEKSMAPNRVRSVTRRYTSFENGHGPVPGTWRTGGPSPFPFDKNVQFSDDGLETMLETRGPNSPGQAGIEVATALTPLVHRKQSTVERLQEAPKALPAPGTYE
ncbi:hypothetical protein Trisim1_006229 [Trichoderma cf. simile WF8]